MPAFARRFILDWVETALGLVLALTLTMPGDMDTAKAQALVIASAVLSALVSAARRAAPGFIAWLRERLGVEAEAGS